MRIFLAGIMQGSHTAAVLHGQNYRAELKAMLLRYLPDAAIYDPLADHGSSLDYGPEQGRQVFFDHVEMCRETDVVLAFLPEASMGTAIEMWAAHEAGRAIIAVTPMAHNWVVRFLSDEVYPDVAALESALARGAFTRRVAEILSANRAPR